MTTASIIYLVDTNIFIYAYIGDDLTKSMLSRRLLDELVKNRAGCVSTQVLNELFYRLTRGVQDPASIAYFADAMRAIMLNWQILDATKETILEAVWGVQRYQLAYWDSLIWAAAKLNGIPYVLSEDFTHGQTLDGVTFLNPLRDDFVLDRN